MAALDAQPGKVFGKIEPRMKTMPHHYPHAAKAGDGGLAGR